MAAEYISAGGLWGTLDPLTGLWNGVVNQVIGHIYVSMLFQILAITTFAFPHNIWTANLHLLIYIPTFQYLELWRPTHVLVHALYIYTEP